MFHLKRLVNNQNKFSYTSKSFLYLYLLFSFYQFLIQSPSIKKILIFHHKPKTRFIPIHYHFNLTSFYHKICKTIIFYFILISYAVIGK